MTRHAGRRGLLCCCLFLPRLSAFGAQPDNPWRKVKSPTSGPAASIGGYSAGCLSGAKTLPAESSDYRIMRPSRKRFYGHPALVEFIVKLARRSRAAGLGALLVGDMGQPRGGPSFSGHASHQNGLDVDLWYRRLPSGKPLTRKERETLSSRKVVVPEFEGIEPKNWRPKTMDLLKLAAEAPEVERILVNPVVKREVCRAHRGEPWVGKLRPWFGHDDHFHVRLRCPAGSPLCESQEAVGPGDGCDASLEKWFAPEMKRKAKELGAHPSPPKLPALPAACEQVLKQ